MHISAASPPASAPKPVPLPRAHSRPSALSRLAPPTLDLQELDPEVVSHVHSLGLPITSLAAPWISSAFSGHLPMEEVLLLWDRVLGLDSLLPLPLLAAAIVCFRRQVILACQSAGEVREVMAETSQLQTMPLLQAVLFQS